ncbi:hypothetical protein LPJ78_005655 [Coemansia sp. RSA 989]|nr:histidine phosphatase superfamily [Coemansia mojavensis]KAJ1746854.1 hypothetical protein LPJ79_005644 [Coemansia sp. RSA 1821]KAJ1860862.1 hypothetical protein LPJ78_005655 [Coemansia sp. RSA 989]
MIWKKEPAPPRPEFSEAAPLPALTPQYMREMYPDYLQLVQAQVFFRHGERTPITTRLTSNTTWDFCHHANYLHSEFMKAIGQFAPLHEGLPIPSPEHLGQKNPRYSKRTATLKSGLEYEPAQWSVRLGSAEASKPADNWTSATCALGQLTDIGLDTLQRTGSHLRALYVDRLHLIPPGLQSSARNWLYVRTTDYSRVIQSTHALLVGLYPTQNGSWPAFNADFLQKFPIHTRLHSNETLHGNFGCFNFIRHFMDARSRDARRLKWIDDVYRQTAQLSSLGATARTIMDKTQFGSNFHPIFDELMALTAHGLPLPSDLERSHLDNLGKASTHQWVGPVNTLEGQRLGFGRLLNEIVMTMTQATRPEPGRIGSQSNGDLLLAPGGISAPRADQVPQVPRLALYGCHDLTVAPLAIIMGDTDQLWHPFATMLTFELFRDDKTPAPLSNQRQQELPRPPTLDAPVPPNHYVRVRLNDRVLEPPTCQAFGKHHPRMGPSMCTLEAFLEHVSPIIATEKELAAECGEMPKSFQMED